MTIIIFFAGLFTGGLLGATVIALCVYQAITRLEHALDTRTEQLWDAQAKLARRS